MVAITWEGGCVGWQNRMHVILLPHGRSISYTFNHARQKWQGSVVDLAIEIVGGRGGIGCSSGCWHKRGQSGKKNFWTMWQFDRKIRGLLHYIYHWLFKDLFSSLVSDVSTLNVAGSVRLGLTVMCQKSDGQPEVCITPELPQEWLATLVFMILGVIALTLTCCLLVLSPWKPTIVDAAKWIVFIGSKSVNLCSVSLIWPIFHSPLPFIIFFLTFVLF